jgi:hypothetical protein
MTINIWSKILHHAGSSLLNWAVNVVAADNKKELH